MTTRQDQFKQKRKHWQAHISAWEQGSESQTGYCRTHNLNIKTFAYWRRKLVKGAETVRLVHIPGVSVTATPMRLIIDDRFAIEVGNGFSPDTLKQLVQAVQGL